MLWHNHVAEVDPRSHILAVALSDDRLSLIEILRDSPQAAEQGYTAAAAAPP